MSANPKDERREARRNLGSRTSRRARTKVAKERSGKNAVKRATPAQELRKRGV